MPERVAAWSQSFGRYQESDGAASASYEEVGQVAKPIAVIISPSPARRALVHTFLHVQEPKTVLIAPLYPPSPPPPVHTHLRIQQPHLEEGLLDERRHPAGIRRAAETRQCPGRVGQRLRCERRQLRAGSRQQRRQQGGVTGWELQPHLAGSVEHVG